ncbi:RNA polymerase sigma factor [Alicyclobacillus sp. ALC3]|uniref:RNA polymerase sigma factor n=1 Tax=Alicyclobacillus sp. ALC3 TaxID=2796143 RepID=UPI002378C7B3|nr:sigma-70 family RNA polymerase sigma factor [Alicyclobacillus sp. ALC3]WDL95821.1 sigma-70 family RNA polymerase sigma factor [Alicyclobacillus sp. ALC3]
MPRQSPGDAAQSLFEAYGEEVYRYLWYTLGRRSEAEDLVQEVFLHVLQSWQRFEHRSTTRTWLWGIVNNCLREHQRKQRRTPDPIEIREELEPGSTSAPDLFLHLEHTLRTLSLSQRQVFVQRVIHERSTADTAAVLGWSEAKVRTTLHRAMKLVRQSFAERSDDDERAR